MEKIHYIRASSKPTNTHIITKQTIPIKERNLVNIIMASLAEDERYKLPDALRDVVEHLIGIMQSDGLKQMENGKHGFSIKHKNIPLPRDLLKHLTTHKEE